MHRIKAESKRARQADDLVGYLQRHFVNTLRKLSLSHGQNRAFEPIEWFRAAGKFGGGIRYVATDEALFDRASVNVSQVQYESDPSRRLASATAYSAIVHPRNPHAPSVHMHISWTESKDKAGYWRMMADLNPSLPCEADKTRFVAALRMSAPEYYDAAAAQGNQYFYIPALGRHRGVSHFYLENFLTDDHEHDLAMARTIGKNTIDTYADIIDTRIREHPGERAEEKQKQLAYHTLYLLQVLTLDRGTTSGLLVHDENDVGILGSLPARIDKSLLLSWKGKVPAMQADLLAAIAGCLGNRGTIEEEQKKALAQLIRDFYRRNPEALAMQSRGFEPVPTVQNHGHSRP